MPELFLRMAVVLEHLQPSCRQPMGSTQLLERQERGRGRRCMLLELAGTLEPSCSNCCHQMMAVAASAISAPRKARHCYSISVLSCSRLEPVHISVPEPLCSTSGPHCSTKSLSFRRTENRPEPGFRTARRPSLPHKRLQFFAFDLSLNCQSQRIRTVDSHTQSVSQQHVTQTMRLVISDLPSRRQSMAMHGS